MFTSPGKMTQGPTFPKTWEDYANSILTTVDWQSMIPFAAKSIRPSKYISIHHSNQRTHIFSSIMHYYGTWEAIWHILIFLWRGYLAPVIKWRRGVLAVMGFKEYNILKCHTYDTPKYCFSSNDYYLTLSSCGLQAVTVMDLGIVELANSVVLCFFKCEGFTFINIAFCSLKNLHLFGK